MAQAEGQCPSWRDRRCASRCRPAGSGIVVLCQARMCPLETLLTSTAVVAIAEIGDKTQLLAIVLAARFRRPWPVIAGILAATLLNHGVAAAAGYLVSDLLTGAPFRLAVGIGFLA